MKSWVFKPLLAEDLLVLQSLKDSLCSTGDTVPTLGVSNIALQGSLLLIIFPKGQFGLHLQTSGSPQYPLQVLCPIVLRELISKQSRNLGI